MSSITQPYSSIKEFIEIIGCSRTFLQDNYLFRKNFPAFKMGRHWRIKTQEALEYIEKNPVRRTA